METFLLLGYPKEDLDQVSRLVRENESFVTLITGDVYEVHQYLLPSPLKNYTAILDRNVYTRITSLVRGDNMSSRSIGDYRWAAAIMAFCQIADIKFQYGSSLQEYASSKGGDAAVSDFECFHQADNCDPHALIDFAVGRTNSLDLSSVSDLSPPEKVPSAQRFEAPIYEYRVNYILALKIALIDAESGAPDAKMFRLMDWMQYDFILGSGALLFANLLFSPARKKGMLKKRSLRGIHNIAWDLALIQSWHRQSLKGVEKSEPVLLITRDKVVKFIANRLVASDEAEMRRYFTDPWRSVRIKGETIYKRYVELNEAIKAAWNDRVLPSDEELDEMTLDLEERLAN